MTYKYFRKGETVCWKGKLFSDDFNFKDDESDNFYIILDGSVNIYLKKKTPKIYKELTMLRSKNGGLPLFKPDDPDLTEE